VQSIILGGGKKKIGMVCARQRGKGGGKVRAFLHTGRQASKKIRGRRKEKPGKKGVVNHEGNLLSRERRRKERQACRFSENLMGLRAKGEETPFKKRVLQIPN